MAEMHALTSSMKYSTTAPKTHRGTLQTSNQKLIDSLEETKKAEVKLSLDLKDDGKNSSDSEESYVFHTQDRSPISTVPKVQICLKGFPEQSVIEESKTSDKS